MMYIYTGSTESESNTNSYVPATSAPHTATQGLHSNNYYVEDINYLPISFSSIMETSFKQLLI